MRLLDYFKRKRTVEKSKSKDYYEFITKRERWDEESIQEKIDNLDECINRRYIEINERTIVDLIGYEGLAATLDLVESLTNGINVKKRSERILGKIIKGYHPNEYWAEDGMFNIDSPYYIPHSAFAKRGEEKEIYIRDIIKRIIDLRPKEGITEKDILFADPKIRNSLWDTGAASVLEKVTDNEYRHLVIGTMKFYTLLSKKINEEKGYPHWDDHEEPPQEDNFRLNCDKIERSPNVIKYLVNSGASIGDIFQGYNTCLKLAYSFNESKSIVSEFLCYYPEYVKAGIKGEEILQLGDIIKDVFIDEDVSYSLEFTSRKELFYQIPGLYKEMSIKGLKRFVEYYKRIEDEDRWSGSHLAEVAPKLYKQLGEEAFYTFVEMYEGEIEKGNYDQAKELIKKMAED